MGSKKLVFDVMLNIIHSPLGTDTLGRSYTRCRVRNIDSLIMTMMGPGKLPLSAVDDDFNIIKIILIKKRIQN